MENKLAITIVALMVAALAVPAVMAADYSATVCTDQATTITTIDGNFGNVLEGSANPKLDSVVLKNSGGWPADVTASGEDFSDGATPENTFTIGSLTINSVEVTNGGAVVVASLAADNIDHFYNQELTIPNEQVAGAYTTIVTLTFANA